jgi:hypothetical protein
MRVYMVDIFCILYENRRMKPDEIVLRNQTAGAVRGRRENNEGCKSN